MMRRRGVGRRGSPLLRGAVVGGAAYAAGRHVAQRQQHEAEQDATIQEMQDQYDAPPPAAPVYYPPPPPTAPAAPAGGDVVAQLGQLAQLHTQGMLTDAEFEAAKAQLLGR